MVVKALILSAVLMVGYQDPKLDQSSAFVEGWRDGCVSANFAAGDPNYPWKHDVARSMFDQRYKSGWTRGFIACQDKKPINEIGITS